MEGSPAFSLVAAAFAFAATLPLLVEAGCCHTAQQFSMIFCEGPSHLEAAEPELKVLVALTPKQ